MSNDLSASGLPFLSHDNYADWAIKVTAAVMKKADVKIMLGTELMPTLAADLSNADDIKAWQRGSQVAAGYILETLTPEARIHITNHQNGPLMWSQFKAAFSHTNSASRITHLDALLTGQQAPDESISSLVARLSEHWQSFVNAQSQGFTLNDLNEELFCWSLIRQLDPQRFMDLRLSLIKQQNLTKSSAISLATSIESGLLAIGQPDSALYARSPSTSASASAPAPSVITPCKWCISKGRTEIVKGLTYCLLKG